MKAAASKELELELEQVLQSFIVVKYLTTQKIGFKPAYNLHKLYKQLKDIVDVYETTRSAILIDYCEMDKDGNPVISGSNEYVLKPGNERECYDKLSLLLKDKVTLHNVESIAISELSSVHIKPQDIAAIDWLIGD